MTLNDPKKLTVVLLRLFYGVETFLRCGDFSTMWTVRPVYSVETFVQCRDCPCKELLTEFELVSR